MNVWYLVVPLNNFASMNNCPWVQGKSNKPLPLPRCVCVGGGIVIPCFTSIFTFINTHEYAHDMILLYDYWMKGLVKLYH